jgi:hypothetical protein
MPTKMTDGASRETCTPATTREATSITSVTHGRPIGAREMLSTRITSAGE